VRHDQDPIIIGQVSAYFGRRSVAPESVVDETADIFQKELERLPKDVETAMDVAHAKAWSNYARKTGMKFAIVENKITGLRETTSLCQRVPLFVPVSDAVTDLAKFASEFGIPLVADGPEYDEIVSRLNEIRLKKEEQTQNQATATQS